MAMHLAHEKRHSGCADQRTTEKYLWGPGVHHSNGSPQGTTAGAGPMYWSLALGPTVPHQTQLRLATRELAGKRGAGPAKQGAVAHGRNTAPAPQSATGTDRVPSSP